MALTFPSSPTNGQVYSDTTTGNRYIYDSTNNIWKFAANNVGMSVSSTPPANVAPGAMWFNREVGRTFVYYDDGDSQQWVETVPAGTVDTNTIAGYVNPVFALTNGSYTTANSGYVTANAAYATANAGFGVANAAFGKANAAYATANAVFGVANTALQNTSEAVFSGTANNSTYYNGIPSSTLASTLRANRNVTGGGTITVNGSGSVLWSARFIVLGNGRGSNFASVGYFDIDCPTSGTITGLGGASNKTASGSGIVVDAWTALYYILPVGSGNTSLPANFRLVSYTSDVDVPHNWLLLCWRNGDDGLYYFNNGIRLAAGQSIVASSSYVNLSFRAWANQNQSSFGTRASMNVSSASDQGSNVCQFNFTSGFVDSNFSTTAYCRDNNDDAIGSWAGGINSESLSASYKRLRTTFSAGELSMMAAR